MNQMQTAPPVLPEAFSFQTPGGPRGPEGLRIHISSRSPDDAVEPCHPAPESQSGLWSSALAVSTSEPKGDGPRGHQTSQGLTKAENVPRCWNVVLLLMGRC